MCTHERFEPNRRGNRYPCLLEKFDRLIGQRGYTNRSEAFRDLIRDEPVEQTWESPESQVVGTVTLVYDHHVRRLNEKLVSIQHDFHRAILSTLHVHLDHDHCLEVVVRGKSADVKKAADILISTKGREARTPDHHDLGGGAEMIVGTGVDLCEVPRIRKSIARFGARFVERIYTAAEIAYVERKANKFERYAARFAAKEAGMKAIGTGWRHGVRWRDFEVANLPSAKPTLRFHRVAAEVAARLSVRNVALSITHTAEMGMAHVILED